MKTDYWFFLKELVHKMSSSKYVPPQMRNKKETVEEKPRPSFRRTYQKSQWELEKEETERKQVLEQQELEKKREFTDENFPSISSNAPRDSAWGGKKTFAALAVEWDAKAKEDEIKQKQQEKEEQVTQFQRRANVPLPQFHNIHRFVEPEDETEQQDESPVKATDPAEEGWVTVDRRKYRRQKTIEEKLNRPPTPEPGDSVWNGDSREETDATCWDEHH
jgi:hypothetical protein